MSPLASMLCRACWGTVPTSTTRPSRTPTSPRKDGPPVPSTTRPPRMQRSSITGRPRGQVLVEPQQVDRVPSHDLVDARGVHAGQDLLEVLPCVRPRRVLVGIVAF